MTRPPVTELPAPTDDEPGSFERGIDALRASDTKVEFRTSRLPQDMMLTDPKQVPAALALGAQRGAEDADAIGAFLG